MKGYSQEELVRLFEKEFGKISPDGGINGSLNLEGYEYPLPNSIVNVNGYLYLTGYNYPLPDSIINVNVSDDLYLNSYNHPLPDSIVNVEGDIWVDNDQKLPKNS